MTVKVKNKPESSQAEKAALGTFFQKAETNFTSKKSENPYKTKQEKKCRVNCKIFSQMKIVLFFTNDD